MFRALACIVLVCLSASGNSTEGVLRAQASLRAANAAHEAGDLLQFRSHLEQALELNPASLATRYNLACAYALTQQPAQALQLLRQLADLGVDYGMAGDPDLASLRDEPAFQRLLARLHDKLKPVTSSSHVVTIDEFGLVPEGIAGDSGSGRLFLGSMRNGSIYVIDHDGGLSRFASIDQPAGFSAVGLTVDGKRNLLWSVGAATDFALDFDPDATIRTGVFAFDLQTGNAVGRHLAEPSVEAFNDVTIAPNGDVYLSGTVLSVIPSGIGDVRTLETAPLLAGTNGIVVTPDGHTLFTSIYPLGLAAVDLASGTARILDAPSGETLYGIDGLYWYDGDLIAIQNGIDPWRLIRVALDADLTAVTGVRVIEFANKQLTATTGTISGSEIRYIGQGPPPDPPPSHVPGRLVPFFGKTIIMSAPLD